MTVRNVDLGQLFCTFMVVCVFLILYPTGMLQFDTSFWALKLVIPYLQFFRHCRNIQMPPYCPVVEASVYSRQCRVVWHLLLTRCCSHGPVCLQREVPLPQRCYGGEEMRPVWQKLSAERPETLGPPDTDTPKTHNRITLELAVSTSRLY